MLPQDLHKPFERLLLSLPAWATHKGRERTLACLHYYDLWDHRRTEDDPATCAEHLAQFQSKHGAEPYLQLLADLRDANQGSSSRSPLWKPTCAAENHNARASSGTNRLTAGCSRSTASMLPSSLEGITNRRLSSRSSRPRATASHSSWGHLAQAGPRSFALALDPCSTSINPTGWSPL